MRQSESGRLSLSLDGAVALTGVLDRSSLFRVPAPIAYQIGWRIESLYEEKQATTRLDRSALSETHEALQRLSYIFVSRPSAFAPIRSRPERTYDPHILPQDPVGGHVPFALRQVLRGKFPYDQEIKHSLISFGRDSGLFMDLNIRDLGTPADPFQLNVRNADVDRNLIDVGYGVSQILPS